MSIISNKIVLVNSKFNFLQVSVYYNKECKTFRLSVYPCQCRNGLVSAYPQDGICYNLLTVKRYSKKAENEALQVYNNNIDRIIEVLKGKFEYVPSDN